ncbi:CHAD domain-containing protein [Ornithinimicrobium faecis]|uniref:CHAD domain-containing protein n=1 Tax=Ornithinimicrobium faecis TaxID=2934158 RepID=UPI002119311D|nr:CHAD domain-containing protein [Ornithinimicrobium sp. HY1745]
MVSAQTVGVARQPPAPEVPEPLTPDFRLHHDEPLGEAVQRIVLEQVAHAMRLRESDDLDASVHQLRKSLKRTRAVLRLVRGELGDWRYRQENTCLRDTARLWGPTRDAAVLADLAADLAPDLDLEQDTTDRMVALLRDRALASTREAAADRRRHLDTLTALGSFACRVRRFPVSGDGALPDRWESVAPGLARVAGRARRRMLSAQDDPTTERLHAWRKDVKYLWYQVEFLQPVWKDLLQAVGARLSDLGSVLGDDHDLAVWAEAVEEDPTLVPDAAERERLLKHLAERRRALQREALALGGTVLHDPDALVEQIAVAWGQARRAS